AIDARAVIAPRMAERYACGGVERCGRVCRVGVTSSSDHDGTRIVPACPSTTERIERCAARKYGWRHNEWIGGVVTSGLNNDQPQRRRHLNRQKILSYRFDR